MDIKAKVEEIVNKAKSDPAFMEQLKTDPVKALESVTGIDLPDEQVKAFAETIKEKMGTEIDPSKIAEAVQEKFGGDKAGIVDAAKDAIAGLFGKKE
ncbi:MAG: hypothetical protein IJ251_00815 [Oscillospiraceae bacterium]|nr:hypothetical protein [Oscillospiraceae bacterium]